MSAKLEELNSTDLSIVEVTDCGVLGNSHLFLILFFGERTFFLGSTTFYEPDELKKKFLGGPCCLSWLIRAPPDLKFQCEVPSLSLIVDPCAVGIELEIATETMIENAADFYIGCIYVL